MSAQQMHERISINSICFGEAPFRAQAGYWREIGIHRVGIPASSLARESLAAAQAALATGNYKVDTMVHSAMMGQHIQTDPNTWVEPRERLAQSIEVGKTLGTRTI